MSFDRLRNLFKNTFDSNQEQSFLAKAQNLIQSARRSTVESNISEFDQYLSQLPVEQLRQFKKNKPKKAKITSLKPQLVKKCYQNVDPIYFRDDYAINLQFFNRNKKENRERAIKMHEDLDEVQVCLFNQISSRFDQILSVLRTIESLKCVVVYNCNQIEEIRKTNFTLAKKVSQRHIKIIKLLKKQENLKKILQITNKMKIYQIFITKDIMNIKDNIVNANHYEKIQEMRQFANTFESLQSTKQYQTRIDQFEHNLKKSFSDAINQAIFTYVTELFPYDSNYWVKKFSNRIIFEEQQQDNDGTVILDESVMGEEEGVGFHYRLNIQRQNKIIENLLQGWRDGDYTVGQLKAALEKSVKEIHLKFFSQCRNFIYQLTLKEGQKKVENPNISNLMQLMSVQFCVKTSTYYNDVFRSFIMRIISLVSAVVNALLQLLETNKTQQNLEQSEKLELVTQKEKILSIIDSFLNFGSFAFRIVYEKMIETVELKNIHDAIVVGDFRSLVSVLEGEQQFIEKNIIPLLTFNLTQISKPLLEDYQSKFDFLIIRKAKEDKVIKYLNKTHKSVIENELRESFQNQTWQPTDIPTFYYDSLHFLISGQSLNQRRNHHYYSGGATVRHHGRSQIYDSSVLMDRMQQQSVIVDKSKLIGDFRIIRSQIIIQGKIYKVTETLLLLVECIEDYMHLAQFYPSVAGQIGYKIYELLRAYNGSSSQLIIFGAAVKLGKIKTKMITAKHLALSSLCLSFLLYIIQCISKRITIFQIQKLSKEIQAHIETAIKKLNSILTSKINQFLPQIALNSSPTKGTESIVSNTKVLHDILIDFYQKTTLSKIFTKEIIKMYIGKLKSLTIQYKVNAQTLKDDVSFYFQELRFLDGLIPQYKQLKIEGEEIVKKAFEKLQ